MTDLDLRETRGCVRVPIRVMPRASKTGIDGIKDGRLVVRVAAPPVDSAANNAVIELIARLCDVPKRAVTIVSGDRSRQKVVEVAGASPAELRRRLVSARD